jgi:hypothetical protein
VAAGDCEIMDGREAELGGVANWGISQGGSRAIRQLSVVSGHRVERRALQRDEQDGRSGETGEVI